jgi:hypothetical protein
VLRNTQATNPDLEMYEGQHGRVRRRRVRRKPLGQNPRDPVIERSDRNLRNVRLIRSGKIRRGRRQTQPENIQSRLG